MRCANAKQKSESSSKSTSCQLFNIFNFSDNVLLKSGPKKYLCFQLIPTALKLTHTAEQVM